MTGSYGLWSIRDGENQFVGDEFRPRISLQYRDLYEDHFYEFTLRWRTEDSDSRDLQTIRAGVLGHLDAARRVRFRWSARYERSWDNSQRHIQSEVRFWKSRNGDSEKRRQLVITNGLGAEYVSRLEDDDDFDWRILTNVEFDYFFQPRKRWVGDKRVPNYPLARLYFRDFLYWVDPVSGPRFRNVATAGYSYQPTVDFRYGVEGRLGSNLSANARDNYLRVYATFLF